MCARAILEFDGRCAHELRGFPGLWDLCAVRAWEDEIVMDLRAPRGLSAGDQVSVFEIRMLPPQYPVGEEPGSIPSRQG
jgi:hypothetical protein